MAAAVAAPEALMAQSEKATTPTGSTRIQPTKLFIGGISRRTTTKQLRDHFCKHGRVLDCVAMRTPDGRPRGFGYVTLDSPQAADRFLAEPQMIDDRIVDMKRAVPEEQTPKAVGGNLQQSLAAAAMDPYMQAMYAQQSMYCPWQGQSALYFDDAFNTMGMEGFDAAYQCSGALVPDCLDATRADCCDLLTGALLATPAPTPKALPENFLEPQAAWNFGKAAKKQKAPLEEVTNVMSNSVATPSGKKAASASILSSEPKYVKSQTLLDASSPCFVFEDPEEKSVASTEPPSPAGQDDLSPQAPSLATPSEAKAAGEVSPDMKSPADAESSKQCGPLLSPMRTRAPPGLFLDSIANEEASPTPTPAPTPVAAGARAPLPLGLRPPGLPAPQKKSLPAPAQKTAGPLLSTSPAANTGASSFLLATSPKAAAAPSPNPLTKELRTIATQTDADFRCPHCESCAVGLGVFAESCECPTQQDGVSANRKRRPRDMAMSDDKEN